MEISHYQQSYLFTFFKLLFFVQLETLIEERQAEASREKKLRHQSEHFAKQLEEELECVKVRSLTCGKTWQVKD